MESFVIPKCDIFIKLCEAHSAIAHIGEKTKRNATHVTHMQKFHNK